jgi:hypothetical protein
MSSYIRSEEVKNLVIDSVYKILNVCADQHEAHSKPYVDVDGVTQVPTSEMLKLADDHPAKLRICLDFQFTNDEDPNKSWRIVCEPTIDLTKK